MIREAERPIFIAAFPADFALLEAELNAAAARGLRVEALLYGEGRLTFPLALSHVSLDDIERAQGGRLLMLAS